MGLKSRINFTQWLLGNGRVVPRRPIGPLLPRWFAPFGWKPKPIVYNPLPLQPPLIQGHNDETDALIDNMYTPTDTLTPQSETYDTTTHDYLTT